MGYFVETFDTRDKRAILKWSRDDHDPYDQWGWAMSWLFDLAGELYERGAQVPPELEYRPSAMGPDISEYRAEGLVEISTEALQYGAKVLHRFARRLERAGQSY